jgi:cytochrome b
MATGRRRVHLGHTPLGALMIYNILLIMVVIGVSGWMMTTYTWFGIEWVEDLHEASVSWAEVSVVLHIAAVVWESLRTGVNLPRAMVTGTKVIPENALIADHP